MLIPGDNNVNQVNILFGHNDIRPLEVVQGQFKLWKHTAMIPGELLNCQMKYKYSCVRINGHEVKSSFLDSSNEFPSKNDTVCTEFIVRNVESSTQLDVFQFPEDKLYLSDTTAQSVIFYTKFMLPQVNLLSISGILSQIQSLSFGVIEPKHWKELVNWIVEQASGCSVTPVQQLYLCIVLSHPWKYFPQFQSVKGIGEACDHLLQ